ncbi:MAG TPA: hypothetical protein VGM49_06695 [Candidatus Limnocylindrales bacterium]
MTVGVPANSAVAIVGSPTALGGHFAGMEFDVVARLTEAALA